MAKLRDLMNADVVTVRPETTVAAAAAGMVRARIGSVIVMQGTFLAGILTERDVVRAAASGEDLTASLVSAWMSADPQSASPDASPEEAAQIMLLNGFRHLPVMDGRVLCGVVSIRDLFAARIRRPSGPPSQVTELRRWTSLSWMTTRSCLAAKFSPGGRTVGEHLARGAGLPCWGTQMARR